MCNREVEETMDDLIVECSAYESMIQPGTLQLVNIRVFWERVILENSLIWTIRG